MKVRTLWMINTSEAVRVTLHRIFMTRLNSAHQDAIIVLLELVTVANLIIIYRIAINF
jgi:hypothetical protein